MNCKICGALTRKIFEAKVLNKHNVDYFQCNNCGFVNPEKCFWLKEAYSNPINISDTGLLKRNIALSRRIAPFLLLFFDLSGAYLDYAGGYGLFTRLMRDVGFDFYWKDPYAKNIFAKGFEYKNDLELEAVTSFELLEHLENPVQEISKILKYSPNFIFSTELITNPAPKPQEWWYYGFNHGQHIAFYTLKSLKILANKFSLNLCTDGQSLHVLTQKNLSNSLFKILLRLSRFGLYSLTKIFFKSKTWEDHNYLKEKE